MPKSFFPPAVRTLKGEKLQSNVFVAHHAEELLRQGVVREEVELSGVRCESRVGGRRVVETGTQRQVFSQQLHVVLYPL